MTRIEELMKLCDGSTIFAAVLQEELKQLVELCRLQHDALTDDSLVKINNAIAAFNKFEGGV